MIDDNKEKQAPLDEVFINPIDKSKVTDTPGLLPYAHTSGAAVIKPIDKGRIKGNAMSAMYEQTNRSLDQIRKQVELLMEQANAIRKRVAVSEQIYQADTSIRPIVGHIYHLYLRKDGKHTLSMIGPDEWGSRAPFEFVATCRLLADHTWDILHEA